ncbi:MAG: hypothetical protein DRR42_23110, partial [Gammaproteobacteria bacterium]
MATEKRIKILTDAETTDLFAPPILDTNDRRFLFTLNDAELKEAKKIRDRKLRCIFVVLLGYFKVKPVVLSPGYYQFNHDFKYVSGNVFPGPGFGPFSLNPRSRARLYQRVFRFVGYERWQESRHAPLLLLELKTISRHWVQPRSLFDGAIEFLSANRIAIPGYTTLQDLISEVYQSVHGELSDRVQHLVSKDFAEMISELAQGEGSFGIRELRQSARNFTATELNKELVVYRHIQQWMPQVNAVLAKLALSQRNQKDFAEKVDYYGAKLKRQSIGYQRLYLLCYLQQRWQKAQERIADGLVHQLRQAKGKARQYAQESVYRDWRKAEKNVSKAAEVLHLFIDDAIDEQQPFAAVRKSALDIISRSELESVCLFLNDQRRSVDEATWQYYEKRDSLRVDLIRELFLCLRFAGHQGSERLAQLLRQAQADFSTQGELSQLEYYKRHLPKNRVYEQDLLAILVGNATNQGTYGISQISDRSYEQLSTIQANYLRLETIETANDRVNNATAKLPIFAHYNIQEDVVHASADGQKFEAKRDTFKTRYSSKYFGTQKGVSAMSLIANHAAINARVIGANEHESHYIFDLLFNNSDEEILLWNECARLVTNAIIYFNSSVLSYLLRSFEQQKD